jgi:hypothetical protein
MVASTCSEGARACIGETWMNESLVATIVGSSALLIAAMLVASHYRLERRRQRMMRHLDEPRWWDGSRSRR